MFQNKAIFFTPKNLKANKLFNIEILMYVNNSKLTVYKNDQSSTLQEIPQLIIVYKICYNLPPGDSSEN